MLAGRRYRTALTLILQLPDPQARFWRVVNEDEELYCTIHDVDPDAWDEPDEDEEETTSKDPRPPYQSWGMGEELTAQLIDVINMLRSEHASKGSGKKPPKGKPLPRPETMSARIQARRDKAWAEDFEDELKSMATKKPKKSEPKASSRAYSGDDVLAESSGVHPDDRRRWYPSKQEIK